MKRHALSTRIWHWINAAALVVLFMSGLNISNAHRYLYWGNYGFDPADAWLRIIRFPAWATIPQRYDLAEARDWHNLMVWPFAFSLLFIWIASIINPHFWRDIATAPRDWTIKAWIASIRHHGDIRGYNAVQKILYGLVLGIALPMMVLTGLSISPGFEPIAPWLVDLFGGRQSARSLHFLFAWALFAFFVLHVTMVLVSGPVRQIRSMITGGKHQEAHDG